MLYNGIDDFICGIIVVGCEHRIIYENKQAEKMLKKINIPIDRFVKSAIDGKRTFLLNEFEVDVGEYVENAQSNKIIVIKPYKLLKKFEEELKELETIIESSFDEIFVTDGKGYTLRVNKAAEINYGIHRNKIVGKHVSELEKEGYFNPSMTLKALEKKEKVTGIQKTNNGKELVVTSKPIIDDAGKISRVITNSRDITEFSNLKKQLKNSQQIIKTYQNIFTDIGIRNNDFISSDEIMNNILETVQKIANTDSTVLLEGESGVGKNMIAKKIHLMSARKNKPFVSVSCGAIPDNLIEAELFGYERGAFTGAKKSGQIGLVEVADGGTLFFDEIAEIPMYLQSKLLDFIQEKRFRRIGSNKYINVDTRIISATNKDLRKMVQQKLFREDLFYRLNVIPITIPPLRDRQQAISSLLNYFLNKYNIKYKYKKRLSPNVINLMQGYNWPGNIRELQNLIERLVVTSGKDVIEIDDLPDYVRSFRFNSASKETLNLKEAIKAVELEVLNKAMKQFSSTYEIAKVIGVNQSTVVRKMRKFNLTTKRSRK